MWWLKDKHDDLEGDCERHGTRQDRRCWEVLFFQDNSFYPLRFNQMYLRAGDVAQ